MNFPSATVWAYNNTISFRMFTFEILNFQNYFIGTDTQILKTNCSQLADFNWHNTNKWWFFIFGISFLLSYSSSQHNLRSDPVCKTHQLLQFLNECYTCILISHLQHSTTQTPISQTLSSQWQRCHSRRPDLSHITDTNVLTTWLNRTQIIRAKLTRSGKIHLDVSSSGQVPSALIHLKTTEDWGATDYKQSSVGSTNQSNTPKEFTSIQNGLNSFNSSQ